MTKYLIHLQKEVRIHSNKVRINNSNLFIFIVLLYMSLVYFSYAILTFLLFTNKELQVIVTTLFAPLILYHTTQICDLFKSYGVNSKGWREQ